jgi:hypothetical protein
MAQPTQEAGRLDEARLVLIVVGAHLRAEVAARPLAYRLQTRIKKWCRDHAVESQVPLEPVVCCDIWYINHPSLHKHAAISLGEPTVNALSAYFHDRLHAALVRDQRLIIQLDPTFEDLRVCLWGTSDNLTVEALTLFECRYGDAYLRAATTERLP